MTKEDLVLAVQADCGDDIASKAACNRIVSSVFETMKGALSGGDDVAIPGFGKFKVKTRNARTGRNPQTGEEIEIPEARVVSFKPSSTLKDCVNT